MARFTRQPLADDRIGAQVAWLDAELDVSPGPVSTIAESERGWLYPEPRRARWMVLDRITVEPDKMNGQPCIRGMRFTVAHLLRLVADGWTLEQIRDDFPFLEPEDLHQALLYAAEATEAATFPRREPA